MTEHKVTASVGGQQPDAATDSVKVAQIEAQIDQTRNAISGDLRSIGERLSVEHLKEEASEVMLEAKNRAVETLHEAKDMATSTFREVKDDAMNTVSAKVDELRGNVRRAEQETLGFLRENAVPLALIGVGVSWFISKQRSQRDRWEGSYAPRGNGRWRYPEEERDAMGDVRQGASRLAERARDVTSRASEQAQHWAEGAEHRVSDTTGRVREFAGREIEHARDLAQQAERRVGETAAMARDYAERELRQARELTRNAAETHPLAVTAAAVAAGIGVGLMLPQTRRESEILGTQRDRLVDGAKEAVQDWTQTAKETARDMKGSLTGKSAY
jgi:vacuolar-type H+-ATPase subunit H